MTFRTTKFGRRDFIKLGAAAGGAVAAGAVSAPRLSAQPGAKAEFDFIVAGAGHNGLVCAAYLARAGQRVLVLEAKPEIGGNTTTEELTLPGYKHEPCANQPGGLPGSPCYRELELAKYGVEFTEPYDIAATVTFADGENLTMWHDAEKTIEDMARFSKRDAESYRRMLKDISIIGPIFGKYEDTPIGYGPTLEELCLQRRDGPTWLRRIAQNMFDTVDEYFEEEHVKAWALWWGMMTTWPADEAMTGIGPLAMIGGRQRNSWVTMKGGCGMLAEGLKRLLAEHDCPVLTDKFVVELILENGRCAGVVTIDGDSYRARKGVISSAHVKQLIEMAPREEFGEVFVHGVEQYKVDSNSAMFCAHYALSEPPLWKVGNEWRPAITGGLASSVEDRIRHLSSSREGRVHDGEPLLLVITPSLADPSRTPDGGHTLKTITLYPYTLADGGPARWDDIKHEVAERNLAALKKVVRNLSDDTILASHVTSPLDIVGRNLNNLGGSCHGGLETASQNGAMRPVPGWASHRMPIKGLYQTGSCSHPGGSVNGASGRNAAWVVLDDMGMSIEEALET